MLVVCLRLLIVAVGIAQIPLLGVTFHLLRIIVLFVVLSTFVVSLLVIKE